MGFAVSWANPTRRVNRFFLSTALHVAAWLFAVDSAGWDELDLTWVRAACAIGAYIPLHLWMLKEAVVEREGAYWVAVRRGVAWRLGVGIALAGLCTMENFVSPGATGSLRPGVGYLIYMIGVLIMYGVLCRETVVQIRALEGLSRLELQILLLGGSATATGVIALMAIHAFAGGIWTIQLQPILVMIFYAGTAIAITTHRVFDARQIVRVGVQKLLLVSVCTGLAFAVDWCARLILPVPLDVLVTTAIVLWVASILGDFLAQRFEFFPGAGDARSATFAAARRENRVDELEAAFVSVIKGWGRCEHAIVLSGSGGGLEGCGVAVSADSPVLGALRQLRWVTTERLARERSSVERLALGQFLSRNNLSAMVIAEGRSMTALVGVGAAASRRPFTYPQVAQLLELASIIESALERAHFSVKAQHAEQLATVGLLGASLAHEIRNPLVSIKTFVQLLPTHHHDPRFREKFFKLIGDEVTRIDQLTEQLLDLASPRTYEAKLIELHPLLRSSLDLVAAKASHRNVRFLTEFAASPDAAFTDASAAKQVMLNLCFNAIQAVEAHAGTERWVKIATRNTDAGIEMAVADSGPGIAPEMRPKLFQPFQTTKSSGFGLGLAICSDILSNLHASISVDPPAPGQGATFRVTFPCQPLSS